MLFGDLTTETVSSGMGGYWHNGGWPSRMFRNPKNELDNRQPVIHQLAQGKDIPELFLTQSLIRFWISDKEKPSGISAMFSIPVSLNCRNFQFDIPLRFMIQNLGIFLVQ